VRRPLNKAVASGLDNRHLAIIELHVGDGAHGARKAATLDLGGAHSQVLANSRVNLDAGAVTLLIRVFRDQLHVHERRLSRLVETLIRHHRVVPIQYLAFNLRGRILCLIGMASAPAARWAIQYPPMPLTAATAAISTAIW
jgi:hypothetical protein